MPDSGDAASALARLNDAVRILTEYGGPATERVRMACHLVFGIASDGLPDEPRETLEALHTEARAWPEAGTPPDDLTALRIVPKFLALRAQLRRSSGARDPLADTVREGRRFKSSAG